MVTVLPDPALDRRGHTAMDMEITMNTGEVYKSGIDIAPGFPGNPLTDDDHMQRFWDCIDFAPEWFNRGQVEEIVEFIDGIEDAPDIRRMVELLNCANRIPQSSTA